MKKISKVLAVLLAVALIVATFAACSSKSTDSTNGKVKVIDIALSDEEYAFGVDKNQPELKIGRAHV